MFKNPYFCHFVCVSYICGNWKMYKKLKSIHFYCFLESPYHAENEGKLKRMSVKKKYVLFFEAQIYNKDLDEKCDFS